MFFWQQLGQYEYEHNGSNYTGWHRCIGGRMADGRWPEWHSTTGDTRHS